MTEDFTVVCKAAEMVMRMQSDLIRTLSQIITRSHRGDCRAAEGQRAGAKGIGTRQVRYHPAQIDEIEERRSLISEPLPPENVIPLRHSRPLHAVLVESLNSTGALLRRLEDGVTVPRDVQREIVRLLYVATRQQVQALAATLELDGLEYGARVGNLERNEITGKHPQDRGIIPNEPWSWRVG
jgi:hypothetical protein